MTYDPNKAPLILMLCTGAVIASAIWSGHQTALLEETAQTENGYRQGASRLIAYKTRWLHSPGIAEKTAALLASSKLIRQERRSGTLYLEYAGLSRDEFDRIVTTLLNSPFVIKKLTLSHASVGSIRVEIEQ